MGDEPKITSAFTKDEIKDCSKIRTPYLETSGSGYYHLWAICCGKNLCGGKRRSIGGLGDDHSDARVIMKTSTDRGHSWGKAQFLSDKGYANAKAIFDEKRNTLVVQYSRNKPAAVFQITSKDHGKTWSKQVEIKVATECGGGGVGGGGQRIMTDSGRMLWYSDAPGCIWYSDDGGKTYDKFKGVNGWNEASFVSIAQHSIYANGRAHGNKPNRVNYKSHDDGKTWTSSESDLKDPVTHGVVRGTAIGLAAGHIPDGGTTKTIYESEPVGIDNKHCPGRACARARLTLRAPWMEANRFLIRLL